MSSEASTKAAKGSLWVYGRTVVVQLFNFAAIAIVARELDLADFGVVALANVAISFLSIIASQGVNQYVIYDTAEGHEDRARAAFWLNLAISLAAVTMGLFAAPYLSQPFDEPILAVLVSVLLLKLPFENCTHIVDAVLHKKLHFKTIEIRDTVLQVCASLGSIYMAKSGYGAWSLVIPVVIMAPIQMLVAFLLSSWRPGWMPGFKHWRRIWSFSSNVIGSTFTSFLLTEGDTVVVGRILGSAQLGIYNIAWRTSNLVSRNVVNVANRLFLPLFSNIGDSHQQFLGTLQRVLKLLSAITFPALIGLFVVADDFIHVIYGEKWAAAVLPLRVLILYAIRYSIGSPLGPALKALGRPDLIFKIGLATVPVYFAAVWIGSQYGIVGVAVGVTITRTATGFVTLWVTSKLLHARVIQLLRPLRSSMLAALLMGFSLFGAELYFDSIMPGYNAGKLALLILSGLLIYWLAIRHIFVDISAEISIVITKIFGRRILVMDRLLNIKS
jgi:PST family polysaccharide transporter